MKKRLIFLVLLVLLTSLAYAQTELNFVSPDNEDFSNYYLTLKFDDAVYKELLSESKTVIKFPALEELINIELDDLKTPNIDYFGIEKIATEEGEVEVLVFPVGYVQGSVVDKTGNLMPNAKLTFTCQSPIAINFPDKTDSTGFFTIKNMPVGECLVIASYGDAVGKVTAVINRGEVSEVEIILEQEVSGSSSIFAKLFLLFLVLLIIGVVVFLTFKYGFRQKKDIKKKEVKLKEETVSKEPGKHSKKTLALMETFSNKEKKIVQFLLDSENNSSQSKIRHATKIPRTSLSRTLSGLERKKIVSIERHGKAVSISLTAFFLD
jgi:uncharacterized membrane protein